MHPAIWRALSYGGLIYPLVPGLILVGTVALAARFMASVTVLPAVFFALVLGMGFGELARGTCHGAGIAFGSRQLLRCGVALLGVQITIADFVKLGVGAVTVTLVSMVLTLLLGTFVARALGMSPGASMVSAGAVSICGASAALAVAAVLPGDSVSEDEVARTVAGITVVGTLAMVVLPFVCLALGLSSAESGLFLGATIHEVAQAVGAGFTVSDNVGASATIVKLLRVACLGAVVVAIGAVSRRGVEAGGGRTPLLPAFVIVFIGLAGLATIGAFPEAIRMVAAEASRWCLLMAIAALGTRVSPRALIAGGSAPLIAIGVNSALLILFVLAGIWLLHS